MLNCQRVNFWTNETLKFTWNIWNCNNAAWVYFCLLYITLPSICPWPCRRQVWALLAQPGEWHSWRLFHSWHSGRPVDPEDSSCTSEIQHGIQNIGSEKDPIIYDDSDLLDFVNGHFWVCWFSGCTYMMKSREVYKRTIFGCTCAPHSVKRQSWHEPLVSIGIHFVLLKTVAGIPKIRFGRRYVNISFNIFQGFAWYLLFSACRAA